jgi:hypothetical protein
MYLFCIQEQLSHVATGYISDEDADNGWSCNGRHPCAEVAGPSPRAAGPLAPDEASRKLSRSEIESLVEAITCATTDEDQRGAAKQHASPAFQVKRSPSFRLSASVSVDEIEPCAPAPPEERPARGGLGRDAEGRWLHLADAPEAGTEPALANRDRIHHIHHGPSSSSGRHRTEYGAGAAALSSEIEVAAPPCADARLVGTPEGARERHPLDVFLASLERERGGADSASSGDERTPEARPPGGRHGPPLGNEVAHGTPVMSSPLRPPLSPARPNEAVSRMPR